MTIEYFVVCDAANGAVSWRGQGPKGSASIQQLPEGMAAFEVPMAALVGADIDLAAVRAFYALRVDVAAELYREQFITPGAGQAMTYQRKEAEARAWTSGGDPATAPFIAAEATARGMTIDALAAEIIVAADAWSHIGARIEGARMGAKAAIATAMTVPAIAAGAAVDWATLTN